jgi:hypothetical protein
MSRLIEAVFPKINKVAPDSTDEISIIDENGDPFYTTVGQLAVAGASITVLSSYPSTALPSASPAGQVIYISDEGVMAYSNGNDWIS